MFQKCQFLVLVLQQPMFGLEGLNPWTLFLNVDILKFLTVKLYDFEILEILEFCNSMFLDFKSL